MELTHVCLITRDVPGLSAWYAQALGLQPVRYGDQYAEIATRQGTLSFFQADAMEALAPGAATPGRNPGMVLEFQVEDVDAHYRRLRADMDLRWVKPPTTQPWGNRSIYFADPEGNLVNLYTRV